MQLHYLSNNEIKKLRTELMGKKRSLSKNSKRTFNNSNSLTQKSFSEMYKQNKNTEIGDIFENNIRQTLINEFEWKSGLPKRNYFFRKIVIGDKTIIINSGSRKIIKVNGQLFRLYFTNNKDLKIHYGFRKRKIITISRKIKTFDLNIHNIKLQFTEIIEIEIDGFFEIPNFDIDKFNNKDIEIIFNNINKETQYQNACCEIKLSMKKIGDLVRQLKKDKDYLEIFLKNKKIIYIGFINSSYIESSYMRQLNGLNNIDIIIFGIKNNIWMMRDMTKYIDWALISNFKILKENVKEIKVEMKEEINKIKGEMKEEINKIEGEMKEEIKEIKNEITNIDNKINFIITSLGIGNSENIFINKKRKVD